MSSFVYFGICEPGFVKIGVSVDPATRIHAIAPELGVEIRRRPRKSEAS